MIAMIDNKMIVNFFERQIISEMKGLINDPTLAPIERPRSALLAFIESYPSMSFK